MTDHRDSKPEETPEPQQLGAPEATPGNPQRPEPSTEPSQDQRQVLIDADLKSARTLSTVAAIAGPVSFIIGGVMLSTVGLVCAIVGFVKIKHVIDDVDGRQKVYAATVRQTLIWGLAISALAEDRGEVSRLHGLHEHGHHERDADDVDAYLGSRDRKSVV